MKEMERVVPGNQIQLNHQLSAEKAGTGLRHSRVSLLNSLNKVNFIQVRLI